MAYPACATGSLPAPSCHHPRDDHHDLGDPLSTAQMLLDVSSDPLDLYERLHVFQTTLDIPRLQRTQAPRSGPALTWQWPRIEAIGPTIGPTNRSDLFEFIL
jgi:hypothetical protein